MVCITFVEFFRYQPEYTMVNENAYLLTSYNICWELFWLKSKVSNMENKLYIPVGRDNNIQE